MSKYSHLYQWIGALKNKPLIELAGNQVEINRN